MRDIAIFSPTFNKSEREEINELYDQIWSVLISNFDPDFIDEKDDNLKPISYPAFIRHSIKVMNNGIIQVLDTSTEPYQPIYNRYVLSLILDNIANEEEEPGENVQSLYEQNQTAKNKIREAIG